MADTDVHISSGLDVIIPPGRVTEEEFIAWCKTCDETVRAEWVDGQIVMMSPVNREHAGLNVWLVSLLRIYAEQRNLGEVLGPEFTVRLADQKRRRIPDILFVSKSRLHLLRENDFDGPPDLAIEIVSPDSGARDWREKYGEYEAAGVREYWVIDPMSQHMEAYTLSSEGTYQRIQETDDVVASRVLDGFKLRTTWLWADSRPKVLEALRVLGI